MTKSKSGNIFKVTDKIRSVKRPRLFLLVLSFAIVGVIVLSQSFAAISIAIEPEVWATDPSSSVSVQNDPTASGGKYVQFNQRTTPTGNFTVQDGIIYDPDGKRFVPIGANVLPKFTTHGYQWGSPENSTAEGHSDDALEWGWNMVRVNALAEFYWDFSRQDMIDGVQRIIDEYTAKKIVVMPSVHGPLTGSNVPFSDPKYTEPNLIWDALIDRNKDNPYFWINYSNEAITEPVQSGGEYNDNLWITLGNQQYQRVREKTNNLFVYDIPIWGQQISELADYSTGTDFLQGKTNVVYSWHNYGGNIKFEQGWAHGTYEDQTRWAQAVKAKKLPVIIGEFGRSSEATSPDGPHIDVGADWVFDTWWQYGFGALWWHGTGTADNWDLRLNAKAWYMNSQPLSASGQRLKNIPNQKPANYQ